MNSKTLKNGLLSVVLAGGALFSAGQAAAASYSVSLDPAFGGTVFTNLSWEANGVIVVPDLCLATNGDKTVAVGQPCSGTFFQLMSVTFYATTGDPTGLLTQTFDVLNGPLTISRLVVTGNELTGIDAGFFSDFGPKNCGTLTADPSCSIAKEGAYSFALVVEGPNVLNGNVSGGSLFYGLSPATGQNSSICAGKANADPKVCGVSSIAPTVTIARIPEPETYALMLAGMAALGLTARRRRKV